MPKPDLIDRAALQLTMRRSPCKLIGNVKYINLDAALVKLQKFPSVDAVPVVRCRECWRKQTVDCPMFLRGGDYAFHDGFCHLGERKEDDHAAD